jgi:hypothetical protein
MPARHRARALASRCARARSTAPSVSDPLSFVAQEAHLVAPSAARAAGPPRLNAFLGTLSGLPVPARDAYVRALAVDERHAFQAAIAHDRAADAAVRETLTALFVSERRPTT